MQPTRPPLFPNLPTLGSLRPRHRGPIVSSSGPLLLQSLRLRHRGPIVQAGPLKATTVCTTMHPILHMPMAQHRVCMTSCTMQTASSTLVRHHRSVECLLDAQSSSKPYDEPSTQSSPSYVYEPCDPWVRRASLSASLPSLNIEQPEQPKNTNPHAASRCYPSQPTCGVAGKMHRAKADHTPRPDNAQALRALARRVKPSDLFPSEPRTAVLMGVSSLNVPKSE